MSTTSVYKMGFLSMIAATGVIVASNGLSSEARRVDVIETLHETVAQLDSMQAKDQPMRVDVIESIGAKGTVYPYTKSLSH